jgi:hypothetical protein
VKSIFLVLVLAAGTSGCHAARFIERDGDAAPACGAVPCLERDAGTDDAAADADDEGAAEFDDDAAEPSLEDASPADRPGDAAEPVTVSAPPEAAALQGTYAVRARWYGREANQLVSFGHEMVWLATIRFDPQEGALKMDAQLCVDEGDVLTTIPSATAIRYPERLPIRTYNIVLNGGVFTAIGDPLAMGYDPAPPTNCASGQRIAARPQQVWNADRLCDCPLSDSLPTRVSDCRVTDPDNDMRPGFAVDFTGPLNTYNAVRNRESSQFVNGLIKADKRHTAELFKDEQYYVMECMPDSCSNAVYTFCPSKFHPVEFVPLGPMGSASGSTCADVIEARRLFSNVPRAFPPGC